MENDKKIFNELSEKYSNDDIHKSAMILAETLKDIMPQAKLFLEVSNLENLLHKLTKDCLQDDNDSERLTNVVKQFITILEDFRKEVLENLKEDNNG